jgi:hypothetical protein
MEGKVQVHPVIGHKGPEGEYRYSCTLSLTSALDGCGCSTPHPGRFTHRKKTQYPLYRRQGGPQRWSGRVRKILPPPLGFNPRTIQHVASRYTDCAIPLKVSLPISRHLCQDTISLLPNLHSNSDEMANQLFILLPELSILRKQNK